MLTHEIYISLIRDQFCKPYFLGVIPYDKIYSITVKKDSKNLLIVNTAHSKEKYGHWVLFFMQNSDSPIIYFDSLGRKPDSYSIAFESSLLYFANFTAFPNEYTYMQKQYQSYCSRNCGYYCIYVAKRLCQNESINIILESFSEEISENDKIVKNG
jgi:Ulp1 protease family, C-terminal catalytic domain